MLFRDREPDPDRAARNAVITALRARAGEWRRCWTGHICNGAQPPRVEVAFTLHADGRITDVGVERVTFYPRADSCCHSTEARDGDARGPLARCVADIVRTTTTAEITDSGDERWRIRYRFAPDFAIC